MSWLKDHSYLATWLSPCIAVLIAVVRSKGKLADIDLKELTIYLAFFVSFAVVVSPMFDMFARQLTGMILLWTFGYIMIAGKSKIVDNSSAKSETPTKSASSQE